MTITKNTIRDLLIILGVEILTVPVIVAYFNFIEPKKLAAVIAASTFVLTGFVILKICRSWEDGYASFVYWAIHIHVFVFSIPMLVGRVAFWEKEFSDIKFLYFTGPEFHKISEKAYLVLVIGTIVDLVIHKLKQKRIDRQKKTTEQKI